MPVNPNKPSRLRIKTILLVFPLFLSSSINSFAQNPKEIDSLKQLVLSAPQDTNQVKALLRLGYIYRGKMPDSSLHFYQKALAISEELDDKDRIIVSFSRIGIIYHYKGNYDMAMEYFLKALELSKQIGDKKQMASAYNNIGIVYKNTGKYDQAIENYLKSLKIKEEIGDKRGVASAYNNIAVIHATQDSNDEAIEYFLKSLAIKEELGDIPGTASAYNNIAIIYAFRKDYESAIKYFENSLKISEEIGDRNAISKCYGNIGNVYQDQGSYKKAMEYYLKALEIKEQIGEKDGMAIAYVNLSNLNIALADSVALTENQRQQYLQQAITYGNMSLKIAREIESLPTESTAAHNLAEVYTKLGNYKKALEFSQVYIALRDSLLNEEKTRAIQDMAAKYESEKKEQQIQLQESQLIAKDAAIKQQKAYRNALAAGFIAVIIVITMIVIAFTQKQKANRKIREQNEQILEANEELKVLNEAINKQNHEILDSISYAERIQAAMLPPSTYISELLNENFIFYKPRDIVSGDFYWIKQVNQYVILVAADCTGHGVPGAFMSMLGLSYLNEIVQRREITQANQVLNELRSQIKHSLRQHGQRDESKDGIDMALCVLDIKNNIMQYSGANNPLYLIKDVNGTPELEEIKADKMPLGYYQGKDISFVNHDIQLDMGDTFYIFSDGFIDQKGGKDNKKFMSRNFKNLLLEIHDQPMYDQTDILDKTLIDWMGNNSQMDDILVVGVRV